uniref:Large ribosomal subunit protein bL12c n=1 Tax=Euglena longa TaxID=3037 RepID=RK12_EUGLO|nr:ribosomal protein L12 [Euglena longa]P58138.1 RecName: Full=Large ribosomal subunit protein bL12c; AltName: Full=50S ribosomal protein L12, plastid [Euglena longa]CAC24604.1 ribosomal protein L12 [Euglena longa]
MDKLSEFCSKFVENVMKMTVNQLNKVTKELAKKITIDSNFKSVTDNNSVIESSKEITENKVIEKLEFNIILESFISSQRIKLIKTLRDLISIGLKEAKDLIETLPKTIYEGVSKEFAEETKKTLEESGASVIITENII